MLGWLSEDKRITELKAFEDYIQFIEQIEDSPPDFCIIRLGQDGIPGFQAADMIRQKSLDIKIIFLSDDRDYALDAFEVRADGYLLCPVKRAKLEKCLMINKESEANE
jgi:DNA-binding NarL/FixJ family response regulator